MLLAKAEEGLVVAPECYRLYDALCASGDLGEKNRGATASPTMLDAKLSARVTAMPGLPESVTAVLRQRGSGKGLFDRLLGSNESADNDEYRARGRLMAALQAADQSVDGGEPSWPALGHLIGEVSFLQAWRQVAFLRSVNASADERVGQLAPLVAKHCCRSLIESRRDDPTARKQALQQLVKIHHHEEGLDLRAVCVLQEIEDFDPACWNRQSPWLTLVMDDVANDLVITSKGVPDWHVSAARRLLEVSPDSPYAKAVLVESDWPSVRKQAAAWEKDAGNQPALLVALGKHHDADGEYAAAVRCLEEAMRFAPEEETCYVLSRIYRQHGENEKWLATLENFLKTPDRGLAHARVREEIALRLMEDKQWAKALPYAEAAAQTGAAWAMMTAAYCHEGMRNWDAAEKYLQQVASAYQGSEAWWYFFCRRTGHGDVEAARRVAHDAIENYDPRVSDRCANYNYHITAGPYFLLEKKYDKALRFYEEDFGQKNNPYVGLQIALLADRLKDFKKRDAALQRIKERSAGYMREATGKPRKELIALADLIQLDLAHGGKGEIDLEAAAKIRAGTDGKEQTNFNYFLGTYLDLHGKAKWATHYWTRCMAYSGAMGDLTRTLAGAELVAHRLPADDDATGSRKIEESPQTK
jgi:tetratricopeptide (TPR) repeat protein